MQRIKNRNHETFPSDDAARVKWAMQIIANELKSRDGVLPKPSIDSPLEIGYISLSSLEMRYLWTAAVLFGLYAENMRYERDVIDYSLKNVLFPTKRGDKPVKNHEFDCHKELGKETYFSATSLYETRFKQYVTQEMLKVDFKPRSDQQYYSDPAVIKQAFSSKGLPYKRSSRYPHRPAEVNYTFESYGSSSSEPSGYSVVSELNEKFKIEEERKYQEEQRRIKEKQNNEALARRREKDRLELIVMKDRAIELCRKNDFEKKPNDLLDLLHKGVDVDTRDRDGNTLLMLALNSQNDAFADMLIQRGANRKLKNDRGHTAADFTPSYSLMYDAVHGIDPNEKFNIKPEQMPVENPAEDQVEEIVEPAVMPEVAKPSTNNSKNQQLLDEICDIAPSLKKIRKLLEMADIDCSDDDGYTPLMLAVDRQHDRIAEYLLRNKANPLKKNKYGEAARDLCFSASALYEILFKFEAEFSARMMTVTEAQSILLQKYVAVCGANPLQIDTYLEAGAKVNYLNEGDGLSALMLAVNAGNDACAEYLLKNNADPLLTNTKMRLASDYTSTNSTIYYTLKGYELISATKNGDFQKVRSVLNSDFSLIHFQDHMGYTALLTAVINYHPVLVEYFLLHNADITIITHDGKGVFQLLPEAEGIIFDLLIAAEGGDNADTLSSDADNSAPDFTEHSKNPLDDEIFTSEHAESANISPRFSTHAGSLFSEEVRDIFEDDDSFTDSGECHKSFQ